MSDLIIKLIQVGGRACVTRECSGGESGLRTEGVGSCSSSPIRTEGVGSYSSSPIRDPIVNFSSPVRAVQPLMALEGGQKETHRRLLGYRDFPEYSNRCSPAKCQIHNQG